jgi:hypothetical protein
MIFTIYRDGTRAGSCNNPYRWPMRWLGRVARHSHFYRMGL